MPINDPVADMLTRIRNAIQARHQTVLVPQSKVKTAIADILKAQGYIRDWDAARNQKFPTMRIHLTYRDDATNAIRGLKAGQQARSARARRPGRNPPGIRWIGHRHSFYLPGNDDRIRSLA